jgi:hypothetical protein
MFSLGKFTPFSLSKNEASPAGDEHFKKKLSRSGGAQSQLIYSTARASARTSPTDR